MVEQITSQNTRSGNRGIVRIPLTHIWDMLTLPEDWQRRNFFIEGVNECLCVVVEHPDIPATKSGAILPTISITDPDEEP